MEIVTLTDISDLQEKPIGKPVFSNEKAQIVRMLLPAGAHIPGHVSPVNTYLIVLSGEILFNINQNEYRVSAGEGFEFPSNTIHSLLGLKDTIFLLIR